jgi:hypothetical protein
MDIVEGRLQSSKERTNHGKRCGTLTTGEGESSVCGLGCSFSEGRLRGKEIEGSKIIFIEL